MTKSALTKFHNLYLIISGIFGMAFLILTPPFGAGDETARFERVYEVATGQWLGAEGVPKGFLEFRDRSFDKVVDGEAFSAEEILALSEIDMEAETIEPYPNPLRKALRMNSPVILMHMAPIMSIGLKLGWSPFLIFYLCRLSSLVVGLVLMREALRILPFQKHTAMLIALLPTCVFFYGAVSVESAVIGLAFLYFAMVAAHAQEGAETLTRGQMGRLMLTGFLLGQFKAAYFLLPLIAILIPGSKFPTKRARFVTLAVAFIPAFLVNVAWSFIVKEYMMKDFDFSTADSGYIQSSEQFAGVMANLFGFALLLLKNFFSFEFLSYAWQSMIGLLGWTNIPLNPAVYGILGATLFLSWFSGEKPGAAMTSVKALSFKAIIFGATIAISLTLLYLQWTAVGATKIEGFQGRYFYPILPLLFAAAPLRLSMFAGEKARMILVGGASSISLMWALLTLAERYY